LTRPEIKNKSEEEIISIIFEKTNIERKWTTLLKMKKEKKY
jgi:hypothetical protein